MALDPSDPAGVAERFPAPPDLTLALRRIAAHAGLDKVTVVGRTGLEFGAELDLAITSVPELDPATAEESDGIVLLAPGAPWERLEAARVVIAVDLGLTGEALEALADSRAQATAAGWQIAHAGLLHVGGMPDRPVRREGSVLIACRPGDMLARALDNGPLSISLDPVANAPGGNPRRARVLIASYEVAGPTGNGGIGTAYHSLAHVLAAAGHDVTLLFTGWIDPERGAGEDVWRQRFARHGIEFAFLGSPWDVPVRSPHHAVRRAYELHLWLARAHAERPFDVVHVPETLGHGAFAMTAKSLGLAYDDIEFVVGTHSSTRWVAESNRESIEDLDLLVTERLERIGVARADVVMSPTAYLLDYMRERGWSLPERTFVQPLARPRSVRDLTAERLLISSAPRELVFFGRLETRKGLEAFCESVDLLVGGGDCPFDRVTFVGRPERVLGEDATAFVTRRADAWGLVWSILPDLGHDEAIAYLRENPCVVAIPSLVDNSPNTVIEAVALGVPFVASRSGGTGELIAAGDLAASTFDGWRNASTLEPPTFSDEQERFDVRALADALRAKAADHATAVAPSVADTACDAAYDSWHRAIAGRRRVRRARSGTAPTLGVLVIADEIEDVRRVAAALARGTRTPTTIVALGDVAVDAVPGVEVVRAVGRETGPARRAARALIDADVVLVLRGCEHPDEVLVERVCDALRTSAADVLSFVSRDPDGDRETGTPRRMRRRSTDRDLQAFVPAPGPAVAAVAYPALSVGPYAIRAAALDRLGGWADDVWDETLDHELLARAALAELRIDVLPEALLTVVRDDRWAGLRARYWGEAAVPAPEGESLIRLLRPFRGRIDDQLADLPALLVGTQRAAGRVAEEAAQSAAERQHLVDAYETRIADYSGLSETYEKRLTEHRDLIALYERQKEEMRVALDRPAAERPVGRLRLRVRRVARGPVSGWPRRGARFARWRVELLRRRLR